MTASRKPDLDLIRRVQEARLLHDAQATPSEIGGVYWIEAKPRNIVQLPTAQPGQFVLHTTVQAVDDLWTRIKQATEDGLLGYKSKVSTAPAPGQIDRDARLIVILTYDSADSADVARVRSVLHQLGVKDNLDFKN